MLATFTSLSFEQWLIIIGCLLLALGLASAHVQRLPISTSLVYLSFGFALGPKGLGFLQLSFQPSNAWFERLTEVAVIVALFLSGMKLRLSVRHKAWSASVRLAGPVMLVCIGGVALFAHFALGLAPAHALLLGAVLAPTDPVLASAVAVNDAADKDRLRYGLSGEAGLNDGTAFPFVILALAWRSTEGWGRGYSDGSRSTCCGRCQPRLLSASSWANDLAAGLSPCAAATATPRRPAISSPCR